MLSKSLYHPPPLPLRCTKCSSDSKRKALRNITALPFSGVLPLTFTDIRKDGLLFLPTSPTYAKVETVPGPRGWGELCSTICNCRRGVPELPPQHKHWTFMVLVLKGSNSAASSDIFIQMRLNLLLGAVSVPWVHPGRSDAPTTASTTPCAYQVFTFLHRGTRSWYQR